MKTVPQSSEFKTLKRYGGWLLGFFFRGETLAIYAKFGSDDSHTTFAAGIKEAISFAEKHRIPPESFGKFLAQAVMKQPAW